MKVKTLSDIKRFVEYTEKLGGLRLLDSIQFYGRGNHVLGEVSWIPEDYHSGFREVKDQLASILFDLSLSRSISSLRLSEDDVLLVWTRATPKTTNIEPDVIDYFLDIPELADTANQSWLKQKIEREDIERQARLSDFFNLVPIFDRFVFHYDYVGRKVVKGVARGQLLVELFEAELAAIVSNLGNVAISDVRPSEFGSLEVFFSRNVEGNLPVNEKVLSQLKNLFTAPMTVPNYGDTTDLFRADLGMP